MPNSCFPKEDGIRERNKEETLVKAKGMGKTPTEEVEAVGNQVVVEKAQAGDKISKMETKPLKSLKQTGAVLQK
ncbi:hypothetical protein E3N88_04203 [Mikania micrantha]|uniref:Uncharacterized protein n=1 Tax=Mikania micrantha TaxID=192012 RepID=A0A5N6PTR7_9ASTR|nr:hypothetical protein E3N88_04203 [Mikania micrantha]